MFSDAFDYQFLILSSIDDDLARAYGLWAHRILANFKYSHPRQPPEYSAWLEADLAVVIAAYSELGVDFLTRSLWRTLTIIKKTNPRMSCVWD